MVLLMKVVILLLNIFLVSFTSCDLIAAEENKNKVLKLNEKVTQKEPEKIQLNTCLSYYSLNLETGECVHDNFLPLDFWKTLEIVFVCSVSLIATACGVGGGPIYSTALIIFENFPMSEAFPITTFVMFCCSLCTFIMGIIEKQKHPETKFVDYDLVVIICPMMLLGIKIGAILNKITPNIVVTCFFVAIVIWAVVKTYQHGMKLRQTENEEEQRSRNEDEGEINSSYIERFELKDYSEMKQTSNREDFQKYDNDTQNTAFDVEKMKVFLLFLVLITVDQLFEGNYRFSSIIGIKRCSISFWLIFIGFCILCYTLAGYLLNELIEKTRRNGNRSSQEAMITDMSRSIYIFSFFAGITSGFLGTSGGFLIVILLMSMNVDTRVIVSTSNLMVVFSNLSGSIVFTFSGQLRFDHAFYIAIPCVIAAIIGNTFINDYIRKTRKTSFLIFILLGIIIVVLFLSPISAINRAVYEYNNGINILKFNSFCNAS